MSAAEPRQHLGNDELTLMLAGELPAADYDRLLAHADACTDCAEVLARLLQAEGDAESGDSGDLTARESADLGPAAVPDPGSRIDHYVVDEAIGRGGMGVVLRARDTALDRDVAIKLLSRRSGAQASERLTREAQAMAKLQHPNVVTVHGVGRYQDRVYLAMELVGGGTLREWCQVADRRWEEVVAMFLQAGEGLAAAHRAGLVHRDFKPSNVMVGEDGRVLVTDFGIASLQPSSEGVPSDGEAPDPRLTQTGVVMGTPRFMAPEQFSGGEVDARADQFAFAVSLYKGLYRGFPYAGRTMQALQRSLTEGAPTPPPQDTAVPRATWRVLERGLRRDADERYPTLAELLAGLRRVLERRRRAKRWTIVAGVAVVGIGAGALASEVTETRPCQGLGGQLKTAWGDARREAVAHALGSVTDPGATHTADAVTAALDRYAAEWTETAEGVCRATHVEGTQSDALLDLRMQCLDQSRLSLRSLSELLATRSETGVLRQSISAVRSLPSPAKCAAASNDDARPAPPEDEAAAVARQRSLVFLGLYDDAYALGAELEATLDDPVLRID
ncbi:MAG: serine/threonine-protein kinase, partial [Myxococcota bacterium]